MTLNLQDRKYLEHAEGYLELGMHLDAAESIRRLSPGAQLVPAALSVHLNLEITCERWKEAVQIGRLYIRLAPDAGEAYLHTAFALHEMGKTREALDVLLSAPNSLATVALYHYNLACYYSQLGEYAEAKVRLGKSIKMDARYKKISLDDPDLAPLKDMKDPVAE